MRERPGWVVVIAQTSFDFLKTHHAFHLRAKAEGVHELTLRDGIHQNGNLRAALAAHFNGFDRHTVDNAILGAGSVNNQQALTRTQSSACEHLRRTRAPFLTHKGKAITGRGAVEGQHAAFAQCLERAGEGGLTCVGHYIVNAPACSRFCGCDKACALPFPVRPLCGVIGYRGKGVCPLRIFAIDGGTADGFNARSTLGIGDHAYYLESTAHGAAQAVIAGTG